MLICLKGLSFCSDRALSTLIWFIFHPLPQKCARHLPLIHKGGLSIGTQSFFQTYVSRFIHSFTSLGRHLVFARHCAYSAPCASKMRPCPRGAPGKMFSPVAQAQHRMGHVLMLNTGRDRTTNISIHSALTPLR